MLKSVLNYFPEFAHRSIIEFLTNRQTAPIWRISREAKYGVRAVLGTNSRFHPKSKKIYFLQVYTKAWRIRDSVFYSV